MLATDSINHLELSMEQQKCVQLCQPNIEAVFAHGLLRCENKAMSKQVLGK